LRFTFQGYKCIDSYFLFRFKSIFPAPNLKYKIWIDGDFKTSFQIQQCEINADRQTRKQLCVIDKKDITILLI